MNALVWDYDLAAMSCRDLRGLHDALGQLQEIIFAVTSRPMLICGQDRYGCDIPTAAGRTLGNLEDLRTVLKLDAPGEGFTVGDWGAKPIWEGHIDGTSLSWEHADLDKAAAKRSLENPVTLLMVNIDLALREATARLGDSEQQGEAAD